MRAQTSGAATLLSRWLLVPVFLTAAILIQAWAAATSNSITFDETFYAGCAQNTAFHKRLDPALAVYGVAPLPVVACYLAPAWFTANAHRADRWQPGENDRWLVGKARMTNAVISGITLMLLIYVWLWHRHGHRAAATGAALAAFSPSLLAHVSLAATDAMFAMTAVGTLLTLAAFARSPTTWRAAGVAAAWGVAYAAKYSAVFLGPTIAIVLFVARSQSPDRTQRRRADSWSLRYSALLAVGAFVVAWALHGFALAGATAPASNSVVTFLTSPAPVAGFLDQARHALGGHPSFLMGSRSLSGWWYYFPVALALKSTPAEWLLALFTGGALIRRALQKRNGSVHMDITQLTWIAGGSIYLALLMVSNINIGVRFALLLYPLLYLIGVDQMWSVQRGRDRFRQVVPMLLVTVQILSAVSIAPQYLAYFTPLVGPGQGWRFLVDSNIDWGQDLGRLREALTNLKSRRVLLAYFGTAAPEAYGISSERWKPGLTSTLSEYDVLAVSVTYLQGIYVEDDPFRGLRAIQPIARAGNSIFIYDLRDEAVLDALAGA